MPGVVFHPGPCYPTFWERFALLFGRKNKPKQKPQTIRKVKGRRPRPDKGGKK